jgi:hypothetical protein
VPASVRNPADATTSPAAINFRMSVPLKGNALSAHAPMGILGDELRQL